uniref:ABC transporter permease n=1 Tax=Sphingomonas bacterium TaxID=1895847 RepID=UPI001576EF3B
MNDTLLTLHRSLTRHRLHAVLNIGGLALGIAVFLVLFLFVEFETGYDRVLPGWDRLWVVQRTMQFAGVARVSIPSRVDMLANLRADYPGTVGTRLLSGDVAVQAGRGSAIEKLGQVDPDYFALFSLPVLAGDPAATLRTPDGAVVTERIAHTYLGTRSPLGRTLAVTLDGKPRLFRVGALIRDLPVAFTHRNDIFVQLRPDAQLFSQRGAGLVTFLRFDKPAAAATRAAQLPAFDARHPDPHFEGPSDKLKLTETLAPLASLHLAEPRDRAVVAALGTVGLLALLIAVANYVNLATARAGLRAREVALRKVMGGTRRALAGQFLAEAIATTAAATLIALAL